MVAQPSLTFDSAYFNGGTDANGQVYGYTSYISPLTYLDERPQVLAQNYANHLALSGKVCAVIGCAFGLTVQALRALGVTAWGMDISAYAISQVPADTQAYVVQGDARLASAWSALKAKAGLKGGNAKFDVCITEDLLSCMSDADVNLVLTQARANTKNGGIYHYVEDGAPATWYNERTAASWKTFVGTTDTVVKRFTWQVM